MRIERVELKNIKPFAERAFDFAEGVNVLSGENGAGKSTVFEAVGYALFGVDAQAFIGKAERFVRKGQKRGEVRVHFTAGGASYVVERHAGASSRWQLFRRTGETLDVVDTKGAAELEAELKRLLGLKLDQSLADQFLYVIGPLQSDFFGPFVRKGRQRTDEFEKILGIESWREAYAESRGIERSANERIKRCEERIASLRERCARYDEVSGDLRATRARHAEASSELAAAAAALAAAKASVAACDAAEARLRGAERLAAEAGARASERAAELAVAESRLEQAKVSERLCATSLADHKTFTACEQELKELRARQRHARGLKDHLAAVERSLASDEARITARRESADAALSRLRAEADEVARRAASLESEASAVDERARAAEALVGAAEAWRCELGALPDIASLRRSLGDRLDELAACQEDAAELAVLRGRREALAAAATGGDSLARQLDEARAARVSLAADRRHVEQSAASLATGVCPLLAEPCRNIGERSPDAFFGTRLEALDAPVAGLESRLAELASDVDAARAAAVDLAALDEKIRALGEAERRLAPLCEEVAAIAAPLAEGSLARRLAAWVARAPEGIDPAPYRAAISAVDDVPAGPPGGAGALREALAPHAAALEGAAGELAALAASDASALAEKRREIATEAGVGAERLAAARGRLGQVAADVSALEADLAETERLRAALAERSAERFRLRSELEEFAGIDEQIAGFEARQEATRSGHELYTLNLKEARQLDDYSRRLAEIRADGSAARAEHEGALAALSEASAAYDQGAHNEARARVVALTGQASALANDIGALAESVERLAGEKAAMGALRAEAARLAAEAAGYERTRRVVEALREDVFNRVSEQLSVRYRADVSRRADRIYRRIAHTDEELRWGDGYRVELVDFVADGKGGTVERVRYDEELSGGQRMSAVVALRLALLQSTGATVGFFDEPTSNLDAARRARLAEAFRTLDESRETNGGRWYTQLFLVSHDVAFSEITDQTTHLEPIARGQ